LFYNNEIGGVILKIKKGRGEKEALNDYKIWLLYDEGFFFFKEKI